MKRCRSRIVLAAMPLLIAGIVSANCPAIPISCGAHQVGNFSPSCTGDYTFEGSTFTAFEEIFTISPPVGLALGASFSSSETGSAIFITAASGQTLDSSVDSFSDLNALTAAARIPASGTYSIFIASPESPSGAAYSLDVSCAATPPLIDHAMTKSLDQNLNPIGRTTTFGSADDAAISWVEVGPMTGIHHIVWSFLEPAGSLYGSTDIGTGVNDTNTYDGKGAGEILLIHQPAGLLPGLWTVNVTIDGQALVTDNFTLIIQSMRPRVEGVTRFPIATRNGR